MTTKRTSAIGTGEGAGLVAALKAGDDGAFEEVVRVHGPRLLAVARRMLQHEDDAQDAVQEALLSAFRSIGAFHEDARLSTWLHRITINAVLMKLRREERRPEIKMQDLLPRFDEDGEHLDEIATSDEPVEDELERDETRAFVRASIEMLPLAYRTVLWLRDIEELDTMETAKLLRVTPNAVKIRLHRARQALRTLIEKRLEQIGAGAYLEEALATA